MRRQEEQEQEKAREIDEEKSISRLSTRLLSRGKASHADTRVANDRTRGKVARGVTWKSHSLEMGKEACLPSTERSSL